MTATRCARCEFEASDEEPLAVHAIGSGHPLCCICLRSLTDREPRVCERCLSDAQALLSGVVTMWGELESDLGTPVAPKWGQGARTDDGKPLPGGDRLVLLAGGSAGLTDDAVTALDADPPSVAFELAWWALGWADLRGEPAMLLVTSATMRTVLKAAGYLETRMRWASVSHPRFGDFHADLKRLHAHLEHATARDLPRDDTGTRCLDCRASLVRLYDRRTGLAEEMVTCTGCRRAYTPAGYALAQAEELRARAEWVTVRRAAEWAGVSVDQVKKWMSRRPSPVGSCCPVDGGERLVWWPDVQARAKGETA